MKRSLFAFSLAAVLASISTQSMADVTYTYQGNPIDYVSNGRGVGTLTMSFTFNDAGNQVLDWWINHDIAGYVSKADVDKYTSEPLGFFSTNSLGEVTTWGAHLTTYFNKEERWVDQLFSSTYVVGGIQKSDRVGLNTPPNNEGIYYGFPLYTASTSNMGTWTSDGTLKNIYYLPGLVGPVPEPSSYALLLAGLGLLTLRKSSKSA